MGSLSLRFIAIIPGTWNVKKRKTRERSLISAITNALPPHAHIVITNREGAGDERWEERKKKLWRNTLPTLANGPGRTGGTHDGRSLWGAVWGWMTTPHRSCLSGMDFLYFIFIACLHIRLKWHTSVAPFSRRSVPSERVLCDLTTSENRWCVCEWRSHWTSREELTARRLTAVAV